MEVVMRSLALVVLAVACGTADLETGLPPGGEPWVPGVETGQDTGEADTEDSEDTEDHVETGETDTDTGPFAGRYRTCETTFRYEGTAGSVYLASEVSGWDEPDWVELAPASGGFEASVSWFDAVGAGNYCYKLIVDGEWILDPANSYRAYCDGFENSGARVADCAVPELTVDRAEPTGDGLSASVLFHAAAGGAPPASVTATWMHDFAEAPADALWSEDGWRLDLELTGLAPGKHTVRVDAVDEAGLAAEPLLLPFWVEDGEAFAWNDALIYMVMIDRFHDGDPSNSPAPTAGAAAGGDWMGGDLRGVTDKIEAGWFDRLGVRALWLTPFNTGAEGVEIAGDGVHEVTGYHGYWPIEPREVDPRLGSADDLRDMVAAAHAHGIRVMMDSVVNHVHEDHPYVADHPEWFNDGCVCGTPGCDWTAEALTCLFAPYMPDIDWKSADASEQFITDVLWWIETYDLDGARIDAVKHVDAGAVFNLATRINERFETAGTDYYLDGETAMGWKGDDLAANASEYGTINAYIGENGLDGQFDFVTYHAVVDNVFVHDNKGMLHLDAWTGFAQTEYVAGAIMTPYIGSHDTSRIVSMADYRGQDGAHPDDADSRKWVEDGLPEEPAEDEPYERARTALCWLLTVPGAPMLYQGDEYGEYGGGDPDNRHIHRDEGELSFREAELLAHVEALGTLRQDLRPLRRGDYAGVGSTEDVMAFRRVTPEGEAVVVGINRQPWASTAWVDVSGLGFSSGLVADELGEGGMMVSGSSGELTVPPRSCAVFVP